jgi:hypothetical protein
MDPDKNVSRTHQSAAKLFGLETLGEKKETCLRLIRKLYLVVRVVKKKLKETNNPRLYDTFILILQQSISNLEAYHLNYLKPSQL